MKRTRLVRDDRGAVAITVAIMMIVFLGFTALVVDMGYLYTVRRQLQAAADAAALAGCRVLVEGADAAAILAEADEYAQANAFTPAEGLVMIEDTPLTEIGPNFVRVTVERESPHFFGRVFGAQTTTVQATAEARVAYVTGLRGLVPLGLPILRATRVYAWLEGNPGGGVDLARDASGVWTGNLPVPALASGSSRIVNIDVFNSQGYKETFEGVSNVHGRNLANQIDRVTTNSSVVVNYPNRRDPSTTTVQVVGTGTTTLDFNGARHTGTGTYAWNAVSPSTTEAWRKFPLDLYLGTTTAGQPAIRSAVIVNSVRSTFPIRHIEVGPRYFDAGAPSSTVVRVGVMDYEYGELYHLKLSSDGEVGNFGPVTFVGGGGNAFRDNLRDGYSGVVRIGQRLDSEPGVQTGPTSQALQSRLVGLDFNAWVAAGMPRDARRLVYVPVIERIEKVSGRSTYVVVSFAAFYLEDAAGASDIWGRFVEYVLPSEEYGDFPPDTGMFIETVRLVPPATEL